MKNSCILLLIFLTACSNPFAGFKEIDEGLHFKWVEIGTESYPLKKADYILLEYSFCTDSDCDSAEYHGKLGINMEDRFINRDFWSGFHLGDRFTLIFENDASGFKNIFSISDSIPIRYPVIATCEPVASYALNSYTGDSTNFETLMGYREKTILNSWISEEEGYELNESGVYVLINEIGNGDSVAIDRELVLSYKAYFYGERLFDNTDDWTDTFRYVVGVPNQVISGISKGIDGLCEGGKAKIIIPSRFAFGKTGSSTGLVPPFEPVKYEIKIIDVKVN